MTKEPQKLFAKVFFQEWLRTQPQFTGLEVSILSYLIDHMDIGNEVKFTPKNIIELAEQVGSTKRSIQTTFSGLLKRSPNVIIKTDYFEYMICPQFAIKYKDYDSIEFLYKAHEEKDGKAVIEQRLIIRKRGKEVGNSYKVKEYSNEEPYKFDPSKFV